jgi:hypothetical protein
MNLGKPGKFSPGNYLWWKSPILRGTVYAAMGDDYHSAYIANNTFFMPRKLSYADYIGRQVDIKGQSGNWGGFSVNDLSD